MYLETKQPPEVLEHKPEPIDLRGGTKGSTDSTTLKKDDQLWIASIKDWMRTHEQEQVRLMAESLRNMGSVDILGLDLKLD